MSFNECMASRANSGDGRFRSTAFSSGVTRYYPTARAMRRAKFNVSGPLRVGPFRIRLHDLSNRDCSKFYFRWAGGDVLLVRAALGPLRIKYVRI